MAELETLRHAWHAMAHAVRPLGASDLAWIAGAALLQQLCARLGVIVFALVSLPGTLAHELAHFAAALALRARPSWPSLSPRRTDDGWQLGSVTFRAGRLRSLPIALAPIVLAPLAFAIAVHALAGHPVGGPYLAWTWVCGTFLGASLPSRQDWRVAAPGLLIVAALAALGVAAWLAWRMA